MKILVIEDDYAHFHTIKMALKYALNKNIAVDNALKLNDAIEFMNEKEYDLIISDLFLPYSNTLMNTIENVIQNKRMAKVVFCSAMNIANSDLTHIKSKGWLFFPKDEKFPENLKHTVQQSFA
ncbi:MAG: response regulator [Chlorobiota bacterium]|jgi:two-component SAPR family response regulator